jgi:outer membrane protein assembly factor BamB
VAVAGGSIYTLGSAGGQEHVIALEEATGQLRWRAAIGPAVNDAPLMRWLSQRTPTVDRDRLYASTAQGELICLQTADGRELWRRSYPQDFGGLRRNWGYVDRPLVDGEYLICAPGGSQATLVALHKRSGELIWKCLLDPPEPGSYPATVAMDLNGVRLYFTVLRDSLIGVRAADGKLIWRHPSPQLGWVTTLTPLVSGHDLILPGGRSRDDMIVFHAKRNGEDISIEEFRRTRLLADHFQDSTVMRGNYLYTATYTGMPLCLEWTSGKTIWGPVRTVGRGKVAITYADQRLYLLYADGTFLLVDAAVDGFHERGKFAVPDTSPGTGSTFPVITGGKMYVRANENLFCYDLRASARQNPGAPGHTKLALADAASLSKAAAYRTTARNKQPDAVFVPTPHDVVAKMLELAEVTKNAVVYDLGSGDGRIVIAAAKTYACKAIGVELDKDLVEQSLENVRQAAVAEHVTIEHADMFARDLSDADVIALYLPPNLMDRLLPQLQRLKPGARIVSHYFRFSEIAPHRTVRLESSDDGDDHAIHLWTAPLRK